MKIFYLGKESPVLDFLTSQGTVRHQAVLPVDCEDRSFDLIVSYGYRYRIPTAWCKEYDGRALNLHIGYLPWNRGADPNLWSWIEGTPKGVTIHYVAPNIDAGDVMVQELVEMDRERETLETSYQKLTAAVERLFIAWWPKIARREMPRMRQLEGGSTHLLADRPPLPLGWKTPVKDLTRP